MAKYEVMKPWHGVKIGQVFKTDSLHPALKSHVRLAPDRDGGELTPATPVTTDGGKAPTKADITQRLTELGIEFGGKDTLATLNELLPDGDPLKAANV